MKEYTLVWEQNVEDYSYNYDYIPAMAMDSWTCTYETLMAINAISEIYENPGIELKPHERWQDIVGKAIYEYAERNNLFTTRDRVYHSYNNNVICKDKYLTLTKELMDRIYREISKQEKEDNACDDCRRLAYEWRIRKPPSCCQYRRRY